MGFLDRLRPRPPRGPARPLLVRYGLGPPREKPKTPRDLCPLCSGEVGEVRWVGHYSRFDGLGGTLMKGRCLQCDTVLDKEEGSAWVACIPSRESLVSPVSDTEVFQLSARFGRLIIFDRMWDDLLAARGPGDEVWRFVEPSGRAGYAVVRAGRPLASLRSPELELERALLAHANRNEGGQPTGGGS